MPPSPKSKPKQIGILSDGTGETAAQMIKAALVQFDETGSGVTKHVQINRYKNVRSESQIDAIVEEAKTHDQMIEFTIVAPPLRQ